MKQAHASSARAWLIVFAGWLGVKSGKVLKRMQTGVIEPDCCDCDVWSLRSGPSLASSKPRH